MSGCARELPALAENGAVGDGAQEADQKTSWGHGLFVLCLAAALGLAVSVGSEVARLGSDLWWALEYLEAETAVGISNVAGVPDTLEAHLAAAAADRMDAAKRTEQLQMEAVDVPVPPDDRPYDYDFLIVIPAAASELERRNAVRNSWAKYASSPHCDVCRRYKVHMVFVVGNEGNVTESRREAAEKGDMGVLEHFGQEKHFTMQSRKTLLSIKYAVQHFTFRYLLKCDTDSWVYFDRLLDFFEAKKLWKKPILYAGNFEAGTGSLANQQEGSKWYDPIYPAITGFTAYPKHAKGAGYVLSRMLAEALANEPDDYWEELTCEDVSVGFWLSAVRNEKVEIPVSLDPACGKTVLVDHIISPDTMAERWQTYERTGSPCYSAPTLRGGRAGILTHTWLGMDR